MALSPTDEAHALQIQAGTLGRKAGHLFEDHITQEINSLSYPYTFASLPAGLVFTGDPAILTLRYVMQRLALTHVARATAISTGALATSEAGKRLLHIQGKSVSRCKSDLVITLHAEGGSTRAVGISTKQCNNAVPTNAQLYFTTARSFVTLLAQNNIAVSEHATTALRQFCGDAGFRPLDDPMLMKSRHSDPRRYFWEEIGGEGREEWQHLFEQRQEDVSRLLLQKAYLDDPFTPEFLLHKTKRANAWGETEVAIYSIDELVALSRAYQGFATKPYSVRKGTYKDPPGVSHLAPRFGIIQMQRGGQAQHPTQLQFNMEAGYFYKL